MYNDNVDIKHMYSTVGPEHTCTAWRHRTSIFTHIKLKDIDHL